MFPRFREQIGNALDLIVEFSTLGEYRLAAEAIPGASSAPADAPDHASQLGGAGTHALRAAVRCTVAGGATGSTPVATPAARRLMQAAEDAAATPHKRPGHTIRPAPARATPPTGRFARTGPANPSGCAGDRRRPSDAPARGRVRKGTPAAAEQLCLAV
jgi:hypothetical protein